MSIEPIDIKLKDDRQFVLVAFFVDRDDFLEDVEEARKMINLTNLPYVFPKYPYIGLNNAAKYCAKGACSVYDVIEIFKDICRENHIVRAKLDLTLTSALIFAESLLKKYGKTRLYLPVVLSSILTGKIHEADLSWSTRVLVIDKETAQQIHDDLKADERIITIQVNRESKLPDIEHTFNSIRKYYFGTKKPEKNDSLMRLFADDIPSDKLLDTAGFIKRDRKWYWKHKNGMSYAEIGKEEEETITKEGIVQAIRRYRLKL